MQQHAIAITMHKILKRRIEDATDELISELNKLFENSEHFSGIEEGKRHLVDEDMTDWWYWDEVDGGPNWYVVQVICRAYGLPDPQ